MKITSNSETMLKIATELSFLFLNNIYKRLIKKKTSYINIPFIHNSIYELQKHTAIVILR